MSTDKDSRIPKAVLEPGMETLDSVSLEALGIISIISIDTL
jgi:hypothetical protein